MPSYFSESSLFGKTVCIAFAITFITFFDVGNASTDNSVIDAGLLTRKIGSNRTIIVDVDGDGDFSSVQAAIDSIPSGNPNWVIIHLRKGIYRERVRIPADKPNIFLRGKGKGKTTIVWSQSSEDHTKSATFKVEAPHFIAFGISFKNEAPSGIAHVAHNQSVTALVGGDMAAFYDCAFIGTHNTLFDSKGRHYYHNCYIQGSLDFIFGNAQSIYYNCEIFVIANRKLEIHGSVTAQHRPSATEDGGFVFIKGKVFGFGDVYLGSAKEAYSRVVFANTYISKTIAPEGWTNWRYSGNTDNIYHAEYKCHGPGSSPERRALWAKQPNDEEVAPYLSIDFINGKEWLPAWF